MQNTKKTRRGDPLGTLKNFREKVAQCRKNIEWGDPLVSSGFVGYVKKVKKERGPFGDKKFRKKVAQCRKKIEKGYSFVPSGFVGYLEKVKNERMDPLH